MSTSTNPKCSGTSHGERSPNISSVARAASGRLIVSRGVHWCWAHGALPAICHPWQASIPCVKSIPGVRSCRVEQHLPMERSLQEDAEAECGVLKGKSRVGEPESRGGRLQLLYWGHVSETGEHKQRRREMKAERLKPERISEAERETSPGSASPPPGPPPTNYGALSSPFSWQPRGAISV